MASKTSANSVRSVKVKTKETPKEERKSRSRLSLKSDWKFLSFDFSSINWENEDPVQPLNTLSIIAQEYALIEDLLHVLVGVEGLYIRMTSADNKKRNVLTVDDGADKLLKTLATKITGLCPLYSHVIFFIDEKDNGLVNQALAASMRGVIKDYFTLIAQLESQHRRNDLTLQKMFYFLQPFFLNLDILKYFSSTIHQVFLNIRMRNTENSFKGNASGGSALTILHNKTISYTGNMKALQFCMQITSDACAPYFEILEKWITEGIIYDPYHEFFIEDFLMKKDASLDRSDDYYWENRYIIHTSRIPSFLSRFQDKILNTGKYLSVIRDCGKEIVTPKCEQLTYKTEERFYAGRIELAYLAASKQLMHLLMDESDLVGHLISVKHYFLMDQGDFIVQFIDMAEDELSKDLKDIVQNRLNSLLELSIRTSTINVDTHNDEVSVTLLNEELLAQMSTILSMGKGSVDLASKDFDERSLKGYESIALDYKVEWPLTLILSRKNIACYQMLFRHLFYCKYAERQLGAVWKNNKIVKTFRSQAAIGYADAFALSQKMLNFVQNLSYYMMVEVIEPSFHNFITKVKTMTTVDEISHEHTNFVEGCLNDCMLTQQPVLENMILLLQLCMNFAEFMKTNHAVGNETQKEAYNPNLVPVIEEDFCDEMGFEERVGTIHDKFNHTLNYLLREIKNQEQEHFTGSILHILNRLDFNEFYKKMYEEKSFSTETLVKDVV